MNRQTTIIIAILSCLLVTIGIGLLIYFLTRPKKCPNNCSNHGKCSNGNCVCYIGYNQIDCSSGGGDIRNCPNNCNGNGVCNTNNTCSCNNGYSGNDCSIVNQNCPNNCNGNGVCRNDGSCSCNNGYSGNDCSNKSCPNNCNNNGTCNKNGICSCNSGYSGNDCSIVNNTCPNNCNNNGICKNNMCVCNTGYSGDDCSSITCPVNDKGVMCNDPFGLCNKIDGTCRCISGYGGNNCTIECPGLNHCLPYGTCNKDGRCDCSVGYYGDACDKNYAICNSSNWKSLNQTVPFSVTVIGDDCGNIKITGLLGNPTLVIGGNKNAQLTYSISGTDITMTTADCSGSVINWTVGGKKSDTWTKV